MRFAGTLPLAALVLMCFRAPAGAAVTAGHGAAGSVPAKLRTVPEPSFDLNGYLAELSRWSQVVGRLEDHPDEAAADSRQLPERWKVTVRQQSFDVPTGWLRDSLNSIETHHQSADYSRRVRERLRLMESEAVALSGETARVPAGQARERLERILKEREFAGVHGPTALERLRERVLQWLHDRWERLLGRMGSHPLAIERLLWALAIGAALAFFALLAHAFLDRHPEATLDLRGFLAATRGWRDWAREARQASERHDYRQAIHSAYWAGIYRLAEMGLWQVDRTRTHREYLGLVAGNPENSLRRDSLTALTSRFERVWYGGREASAEDYAIVVSELETLGCQFQ